MFLSSLVYSIMSIIYFSRNMSLMIFYILIYFFKIVTTIFIRIKRTTPVARPEKMPLMNRSDVRYTLNDITTQSPYFISDVELVNSLAGTPNDNMFKQALMNRLGMDKWDNTTALNRLNFLGIKGHIGGNDRKRLRNLINKGTTSNGEIRK